MNTNVNPMNIFKMTTGLVVIGGVLISTGAALNANETQDQTIEVLSTTVTSNTKGISENSMNVAVLQKDVEYIKGAVDDIKEADIRQEQLLLRIVESLP